MLLPSPTAAAALSCHRTHDDAVAEYLQWKNALPHSEILLEAGVLTAAAMARYAHDQQLSVEVRSAGELDLAVSAGIAPAQLLFHCDSAATRTVWHAVGLGVGRLVLGAERQIVLASACAPRPQRVLVDIAGYAGLISPVLAEHRLQLIGLHRTVGQTTALGDVTRAIEVMAQLRRDHAIVLTQLALKVGESTDTSPRAAGEIAAAIDIAVNTACARLRFPRPALSVIPDQRL